MVILFSSCMGGVNKEELRNRVIQDIDNEFNQKANDYGISYEIVSFDLLHNVGNEYNGLLKTIEDGETFNYSVKVTVEGDNYLWIIE